MSRGGTGRPAAQIVGLLVEAAAWFLPSDARGRYRDEWLAELDEMTRRGIAPLPPGLRILLGAPAVGHALRAARRRARVPRRRATPSSLPYVVKKSVVALATGGITFVVTNLTNVTREWVLLLSCFIAGVILVIQFLVDFEGMLKRLARKLDDHDTAMAKLVERRISDIEKVELFGLLARASVDREIVAKFLRHAINLDGSSPLLYKFAHAEIGRVSDLFEHLGHGNIAYTGEDHDWLLELTESAQATVDATSLSSVDASAHGFDGGLWVSGFGSRYLKYQKEAIARNVRIRRVFILEDAETATDEAFRSVCRWQVDIGIEVRVLRPADVPPSAVAGPNDFILFDNTISYEVTPSSQPLRRSGPATIDKTRLVRGVKEVKANADRFEALWQVAEPFSG